MFPQVVRHMEEGAEVLAGPLPICPEAGAVMEAAVESFREEVSCGRKDFILVNTVLYVLAVWYHDRIWLSISKKASEKYQRPVWLPDCNVYEKPGYMDICASLCGKNLVL